MTKKGLSIIYYTFNNVRRRYLPYYVRICSALGSCLYQYRIMCVLYITGVMSLSKPCCLGTYTTMKVHCGRTQKDVRVWLLWFTEASSASVNDTSTYGTVYDASRVVTTSGACRACGPCSCSWTLLPENTTLQVCVCASAGSLLARQRL